VARHLHGGPIPPEHAVRELEAGGLVAHAAAEDLSEQHVVGDEE
jgi:hypothetical protein